MLRPLEERERGRERGERRRERREKEREKEGEGERGEMLVMMETFWHSSRIALL